MARKRYLPEQIIGYLREVEVLLSQGSTVPQMCRKIGVAEQTYYRWCKEYGSLSVDQNILEQLGYLFIRGLPDFIRSDHGPEFTSKVVRS